MNKHYVLNMLHINGSTQTALAKLLGIDKSQITRLLDGERDLKAKEVVMVADFLRVEPMDVLNNLN